MIRMGIDERRARLVTRHRLAPEHRAETPMEVARSLVALHSTDPGTVFLSTWARGKRIAAEDVEQALYADRGLVRVLCMRRTLFVVERELVPVVHAACTREIAARERRRLERFVADSGVAKRPGGWITRACREALRALEELGEASTAELVAAVPMLAARVRLGVGTRFETTQSAGSRILLQLAMEGRVVRGRARGSWVSGQYRWSPTRTWLGEEIAELDAGEARSELARRWLRAFGPATETDLRWWTGWTARDARAALTGVAHELVALEGGPGLVLADDLDPIERRGRSAALLPVLDPTTMGWKERDWYLGAHGPTLFDRNGNAGPTVWWEGKVVGGWAQRPDGGIAWRLLEDVGAEARAAIESEAQRLQSWLGEVRVRPGFLPPFQRALAE